MSCLLEAVSTARPFREEACANDHMIHEGDTWSRQASAWRLRAWVREHSKVQRGMKSAADLCRL